MPADGGTGALKARLVIPRFRSVNNNCVVICWVLILEVQVNTLLLILRLTGPSWIDTNKSIPNEELFSWYGDFSWTSHEWLTELIVFCKQHDIILRILEGTPSHDRNQSKVITSIIKKLNIELDYKYIDTLYIEHQCPP